MNRIIVFMLLLAFPFMGSAQERDTLTLTHNSAAPNGYTTTAPIDVTVEHSKSTLSWGNGQFDLCPGDLITKMVFKGYNPGNDITRHVKITFTDGGKNFVVFDDVCTIPHGGTEEDPIALMDINLPNPHSVIAFASKSLTVESEGESREDSVFFQTYSGGAFPIVTVLTEMQTIEGTIINQDGLPVAGAQLFLYQKNFSSVFKAQTNSKGEYSLALRKNLSMQCRITAPGCAPYHELYFWDSKTNPSEVVLTDAVHYKAGQRASIILPVNPDPSLARYYKLAFREMSTSYSIKLYFEREENPQANTPYVIFPEQDFDVILADYDLSQLPDTVFVPLPHNDPRFANWNDAAGIYGCYSNKQLMPVDNGTGFYFLDEKGRDNGWRKRERYIESTPPFRCFIKDKSPDDRDVFVFIGEDSSIEASETMAVADNRLYDLLGRRVQGQPRPGVYIRDGRKIVSER